MAKEFDTVEFDHIPEETGNIQVTGISEEVMTNPQYPLTFKMLQELQIPEKPSGLGDSKTGLNRKIGIIIRAHADFLPEEAFRVRSGQGNTFLYSQLMVEKLGEYFREKARGISDTQYTTWVQEQNAEAIAALESKPKTEEEERGEGRTEASALAPTTEGVQPDQVSAMVLANGQRVQDTVDSLPVLSRVKVPDFEITLPKQMDVVEGVEKLFNLVKAETEKSINTANAERAKLTQVNQLVNGIQQMVAAKAEADHQKAQDSATLEQMGENLEALQKMLGK